LDIDLLKTFLEVNKTRHFSRAADNLFVTSAAVSARIKLLEGQLGVPLFIRHRGNMQLTNEGEKLVPLAETIITTWARTLQEVSLQSEMDARIHIGATSSMWMLSMQEKLLDVVQQFPGIAVQAEGHSNNELTRFVVDRSLDLVLLPDPPASTEFRAEKIGELTLVLAAPTETRASAAFSKGYIYVDWGTAFASWHASKFGEQVAPSLHVNLASIAVSVLLEKDGAAFLPRSQVDSTALLVKVAGIPSFRRPIYACYREANERIEIIRQVVACLKGISV
jgi:DNA-binding transcriptional LysR family regulator